MTSRIVLSALCLLALVASACQLDANGIGTSPSYDDDPVTASPLPLTEGPHCGLWEAPTLAEAEARHTANPKVPDMEQHAVPGGLSCSALVAAQPAIDASFGGVSVIRYWGTL